MYRIEAILIAIAFTISISSCGGSSSTTYYTITAISGGHGAISPDSVKVKHGEVASFTVSADNNFVTGSVVGCGGSLVDDTYTTGSITENCTVTASFVTPFELIDPTARSLDQFGRSVIILANGNLVVTDSLDSSVAAGSGAVHLYNPSTQKIISSIYGNNADDRLGINGIFGLSNNNFVIASSQDDIGDIVDAGSVRLIDGSTGAQISNIAGDVAGDQLGLKITVLANNNFVIASALDDEGGIVDAGSVRLIDGSTGIQTGAAFSGDTTDDQIGSSGVTALANNKYVLVSQFDDVAGIINAGSLQLFDGSTGIQIGAPISGDITGDLIGYYVTELLNYNFVFAATQDDEGGKVDVGTVRLINGSTGAQVGTTLIGDIAGDRLGYSVGLIPGARLLANNNYVIASGLDDEAGIVDAGSVRLMNGTTGSQIGATLSGTVTGYNMGGYGVTALANSHFVIASPGGNNVGLVQLIDGSTGGQIGLTQTGDDSDDSFGRYVTALANNNYVIVSPLDDEAGIIDAGSVRLMNGSDGTQIGSTVSGDIDYDTLGWSTSIHSGITALSNSNFIISSPVDDEAGLVDAGSVRLMNGSTGAQIGIILVGDAASDQLGRFTTGLSNNNFVVASPVEDDAGVVDAGTVRLMNGSTGVQIGATLAGDITGDALGGIRKFGVDPDIFNGVTSLTNNNYVILSTQVDEAGTVNAGSIRVVDGDTGVQIGSTITGSDTGDFLSATVTPSVTGNYFILAAPYANNRGLTDSGLVRLVQY